MGCLKSYKGQIFETMWKSKTNTVGSESAGYSWPAQVYLRQNSMISWSKIVTSNQKSEIKLQKLKKKNVLKVGLTLKWFQMVPSIFGPNFTLLTRIAPFLTHIAFTIQTMLEIKIESLVLSLTRVYVWNLWLDQRTANVRHKGLTWYSMNIINSIKLRGSKINIISYGRSSEHIRGQYQVINNIFDMLLQVESI